MAKKTPTPPKEPAHNWTIVYEATLSDGTPLEVGTQFALKGEAGKSYRFIRLITNEKGDTWVDCFGGGNGRKALHCSRSILLDRIRPNSIKRPKRTVESKPT